MAGQKYLWAVEEKIGDSWKVLETYKSKSRARNNLQWKFKMGTVDRRYKKSHRIVTYYRSWLEEYVDGTVIRNMGE